MDAEQAVRAYWQAYRLERPNDVVPDSYQSWGFGNSLQMADELGSLVLEGIKTATASLYALYEIEGETLPQVGGFSIILDGKNRPLCIIETTEVTIQPFNQVDAQFAYDEGEGDRSLNYWRKVHWEFFGQECVKAGYELHERMLVVCERFRKVYPFQGYTPKLP